MSEPIIKLENISKQYRLGLVGTNTLRGDIQRWWYRMRGKEDPTLKIGEENQLDSRAGEYVWALRDINLEVQQGEVLGIIGKNGAGKSTLLKILSRVTGPTTGRITAHGRIASLLEVGTGFHPELTGRENIFLNGAILGMTKQEIRSKFDEIVDFAGVAKYVDTPVKRYSSGMYVRLAFAVAAHLEPEILIVDEVLAVGDAEFQKKAIGKMQDISKGGGRTVLFVSHNMASVEQLCTRAMVLKNGVVAFSGSTGDAINFYTPKANHLKANKKITINEKYGTGEIVVKEINFKSLDGNTITFLKTGQSFLVEFTYSVANLEALYLQNINVSFAIYNDRDERLFNTHNKLLGSAYSLKDFTSNNQLILYVHDLPLVSGAYYFTYNIYNRYELINKDDNKYYFEVKPGKYYNKIVNKRDEDNQNLLNAEWRFS